MKLFKFLVVFLLVLGVEADAAKKGKKKKSKFGEIKQTAPMTDDKIIQIFNDTVKYVNRRKRLPAQTIEIGKKLCSAIEKEKDDNKRQVHIDRLKKLRRKILFSHPDLRFDKILINRTPPTKYSHNGDQHLGRHSRTGKGMTVLENWKSDDIKVKTLFKGKLPEGSYRSPDIHYDGQKFLFAFTPTEEIKEAHKRRYFIYEGAIDGSWVRQVTGTKNDDFDTWKDRATALIEDNDPCYLPDNDIVFISTRSQTYGRCHGGRYNPAWVLYRCDKNGQNIKQLSFGNENEYDPNVLHDGRVVYSRWEYTSRHEMFFHMLWSTRPDGTGVSNFFGNDMVYPMMITHQEAIPKSQKIVAVATGHHSYSTGTVIVIDPKMGENGEQAITHITPQTGYPETPGVGWPSPHYSHPFPINDKLFLVSKAHHPVPNQGKVPPVNDRGIYLIDVFGGEELIFEDEEVASFSPIPIRPKKRPSVIPSVLPKKAPNYGTVYIQNIYETRNDPEKIIKPGSIKAVRVNMLGVQPRARRTILHSLVSVEMPRKILGTVPVNPDGSVLFKVPAGESFHLQALDKYGQAILSERSFWYLQPGEVRSCVGCHEDSGKAPLTNTGKILSQKAKSLRPPAGPRYTGGISFMRTVQPVLDRYCISCHGLKKTAGKINLIHDGEKIPRGVKSLLNMGKHHLGSKGYMSSGGLEAVEDKNISRPYQYLAAASKLPKMLRDGHGKVKLNKSSYMRIVEWLDMNGPVYGDLFPNKLEERKFDKKAFEKLRQYIKSTLGKKLSEEPERALVNVAQPSESRILMAPLAKSAGGWGQLRNGWSTRQDPRYKKMVQLVKACIIRDENENIRGWEPTIDMGGGEEWIIRAREEYLEEIKSQKK